MSFKKQRLFKFLVWFVGVIVFLVLAFNITFYYVLHSKLPQALAKNDLDYSIEYSDLIISFFSREITLNDIDIHPTDTIAKSKTGIYATANKIKLYDVSLFHILTSNQILIGGLEIEEPNIKLFPLKKDSKKIKNTFGKILKLDVFNVTNGSFEIYKEHELYPFLLVDNFDFKLNEIEVTPEGLKKKIPFTFSDYTLTADSFTYITNQFYTINAQKINATNTQISLHDFNLKPNYSKNKFLKQVNHQVDIYDVSAQKIKLDSVQWGFKADKDFYITITTVNLDKVSANISRDKSLPENLRPKPMYSQMLRDIPFFLTINQIKINDSNIVYNEEQASQQLYGNVNFSKFNANIKNLASGYKQKQLPDVKIDVACKFYDIADLHVDWDFNVLNPTDYFTIKGTLNNLPADRVNKFIEPSFNVSAQGNFKALTFNYSGNNEFAKGKFAIDYSQLHVTFFRKDGKKNKFLSFVGNVLVKKDTENKFKHTEVKYERDKNKSFFNLIWKTTAQGLEHTLLVI